MKDLTYKKEFLQKYKEINLYDAEVFRAFINDTEFLLGLSTTVLSQEIRMPAPTINKWKSGESIPMPLMRPSVIKFIKALIK